MKVQTQKNSHRVKMGARSAYAVGKRAYVVKNNRKLEDKSKESL